MVAQVHDAATPTRVKVSADSAAYATRNATTKFTDLLDTIAFRKGVARCSAFIILVVLLAVGVTLACLPWDTLSSEEAYDPAVGLAIDIAGCDVRLVEGASAIVLLEARRAVAPVVEWTRTSTVVAGVRVHNTEWPCEDAPLGLCSSWCRLTVSVPPAASDADFTFAQSAADGSHPSITIGSVAVGALATLPSGTPLPSASFTLVSTSVGRSTDFMLHEGSVHGVNASLLGTVRMVITAGGSVQLLEAPLAADVQIDYAQPSGLVCVVADDVGAPAIAEATSTPLAACPLASDAAALSSHLSSRYDGDGDGMVSTGEFTAAAEQVACCGPFAPHICSCAVEATRAFGSDAELSVAALGERLLISHNYSSLVGSDATTTPCLTRVDVPASTSGGASAVAFSELRSAYGDVSVSFVSSGGPFNASMDLWPRSYSPIGFRATKGPKLARPDAEMLSSKYGGSGEPSSTAALYLIIDVVSSVGRPWSRWVYTTSDAYLAIDPSQLALLSGYAVSPTVYTERVRLVNDDCTLVPPPTSSAAFESRSAAIASHVDLAIYEQLRKTLLSSATSPSELRGALVRVDASSTAASTSSTTSASSSVFLDTPSYLAFEPRPHGVNGERLELRWDTSNRQSVANLYASASLALAFGIALGAFALCGLWRWAVAAQRDAQTTASARARAVLTRHELPEAAVRTWLAREGMAPRVGAEEYRANPILAALATADHLAFTVASVFSAPIRERLVSSVDRFVASKLREAPLQQEGKGGACIEMRSLVQQYELFCIAHGFPIAGDAKEALHRHFAERHVVVRQSFVRRIFGLRWRNPRDPLDPGARKVTEAEMPPELRWGSLYAGGAKHGRDPDVAMRRLDEEEKAHAAGKKPKGQVLKEGGEFARRLPPLVEHGGKLSSPHPPAIDPLTPVRAAAAQQQQRFDSATRRQKARLQRPEGDEGEGEGLPPLPKYMYDERGQIVYDDYGHPKTAPSTPMPASGATPQQQPPVPTPQSSFHSAPYGSDDAPPPPPPPSPPASPPALVPPPEGGYPQYATTASSTRRGYALHASYLSSLQNADGQLGRALPSLDAGPTYADTVPSDWWVLRRFLRETCYEEPSSLHYYIDLEDTLDPSAITAYGSLESHAPPMAAGFRAHLYEWCRHKQRGLPLPTLQGTLWSNALPEGVRFADQLRVRHVLGLEWKPSRSEDDLACCYQLSVGWLLAEAVDVALHVGLLIVLPLVTLYYALDAQRQWATTLCLPPPPTASGVSALLSPGALASVTADGAATATSTYGLGGEVAGDCGLFADFAPIGPKVNPFSAALPLPIVTIVLIETLLITVVSSLRLLLSYGSVGRLMMPSASGGALHFIATHLSGLLVLLHLWLTLSAIGMVVAWHVLGGAADPIEFLPSYAAVLSLVLVVLQVGRSMWHAARSFKTLLKTRFLQMLQPPMQAAYHRAQLQLALQRSAAVGKHLARPANWEDIDMAEAALAIEQTRASHGEPSNSLTSKAATAAAASASTLDGSGARLLTPIDVYLVLAGDGRKPLLVEDFRPRFETLNLPLTASQKEVLFSQVETKREVEADVLHARFERRKRMGASGTVADGSSGGIGSGVGGIGAGSGSGYLARWRQLSASPPDDLEARRRLHEEQPIVTAAQFVEGWEAMQQGLLQRGLESAGVSAAQIGATVLLSTAALFLLLLLLFYGVEGLRATSDASTVADMLAVDDTLAAAFVSLMHAIVILSCAAAVIAIRPRAKAELEAMGGLVKKVIDDDLEHVEEA